MQHVRDYRQELDARPCPAGLTNLEWEHRKNKLAFAFVDNLLDHQNPVTHLADDRQAQIVADAFLHFAGVRYTLFAYVVMPSHHHWLFQPIESWAIEAVKKSRKDDNRQRTPREIISQSIQSYTATMCNRVRGVTGTFWQDETYDHWVRNDDEFYGIIRYIEDNPVKAELVTDPAAWKWSSAHHRLTTNTKLGEPLLPTVG